MTISNESIKTTVQGNGVQTTFSYNFLIPTPSAAELYLLDTVTGDTILLPAASWQLNDAGNPAGGTFLYPRGGGSTPASSTQTLTLVRTVPYTQNTNLGNQNAYYPRAVEAALDWIVMQVQQFVDEAGRALRVPISEQGLPELLPAAFRTNTLLSFDSAGAVALLPIQPDNNTTVIAQGSTIARTLAARFADMVNVLDHGAVPDWNGTTGTDNTAAFASAFAYAASTARMVFVPYGDFYAASPLWLQEGALGIMMQGTLYSPGGFAALTLGGNGATRNQNKVYGPVRVMRTTQSNWSSEADIGVRIWNADNCVCAIERSEKFTIAVQLASDLRGVEDSDFFYGRLIDAKVGVDMRTFNPGPDSYVNSCRHYGGHFANSSSTNQGVNRFGVRLSKNSGGDYNLHNSHTFYSPAFELQIVGGHLAIPFMVEVSGRGLEAKNMRMEACSAYAAWHSEAMNDCIYELQFVGTYGPFVTILYTGATRAGGTVRANHQTSAAQQTPRLIAGTDNLRGAAYLDETISAGGIGFERMAVMSSNPSGGPTTMNTLLFPGLTLLTPNTDNIGMPTSRAIGFVLDLDNPATPYGIPREIALQAEGFDLVGIVSQFNASEVALGTGAPVLWSNANAVFNDGAPNNNPYWWETNVPLDQLSGGYPLFMWQRVTFHPSARYAFVGVRGGSGAATLRALRLFGSGVYTPQIIYGGTRTWGLREITRNYALDPASIPAGGSITSGSPISFPGARASYFTQVSFQEEPNIQTENEFITWNASVRVQGASGTMRWRAFNSGASAVDLGAGTLRVMQTKPRV